MVGGTDFDERPFNLAVNGHRQPGSSIKPFILDPRAGRRDQPGRDLHLRAEELPGAGLRRPSTSTSPTTRTPTRACARCASALATSDNSVFAELGLKVGTKRVARIAERMGVSTPVSTNPAMTLGGLEEGVTPLEMAYAYSTIANKGRRVSGTLAPGKDGPVAIESVKGGGIDDENEQVSHRAFPEAVGETALSLMGGVVSSGTGKAAAVGDEFIFGKTGTTENYGDAWFVGWQRGPDGGRLGRLSGPAAADADRVPRRAGRRRHLPGRDLPRLHGRLAVDPRAPRRGRGRRRRGRRGVDPDPGLHARAEHAERGHPAQPTAPAEEPEDGSRPSRRQQAPQQEAAPAPAEPAPQAPPAATPAPQTPATPAPAPTPTPPSGGTGGGVDAPRLGGAAAHRRRPRARDVAAVRVAEAPGQLDGLGDADALAA